LLPLVLSLTAALVLLTSQSLGPDKTALILGCLVTVSALFVLDSFLILLFECLLFEGFLLGFYCCCPSSSGATYCSLLIVVAATFKLPLASDLLSPILLQQSLLDQFLLRAVSGFL